MNALDSTAFTPALQTRNLSRSFGGHHALSDCSLVLPQGHVIALLGPNGAGKTTLLALAAGMMRPTSGTISVLGRPPAVDAKQISRVGFVAQDVGFVAQEAPLYPGLSSWRARLPRAATRPGWPSKAASTLNSRCSVES